MWGEALSGRRWDRALRRDTQRRKDRAEDCIEVAIWEIGYSIPHTRRPNVTDISRPMSQREDAQFPNKGGDASGAVQPWGNV